MWGFTFAAITKPIIAKSQYFQGGIHSLFIARPSNGLKTTKRRARKSMQDTISKRDTKKYEIELPQTIIDEFARFLVPEIRKFYASEEGQRLFAEWQAQQIIKQ